MVTSSNTWGAAVMTGCGSEMPVVAKRLILASRSRAADHLTERTFADVDSGQQVYAGRSLWAMARPGLESDGFVNHAFQLMSFRVTVAARFRACDKARVHPVAQVVRVLLAAARHDQVDLPTPGRDQDIEAPRLLGDAHHGTCCRQLAIQEDLKDHPWLACDEGAIVPVHQVIVHPGKCDEAPVRRGDGVAGIGGRAHRRLGSVTRRRYATNSS